MTETQWVPVADLDPYARTFCKRVELDAGRVDAEELQKRLDLVGETLTTRSVAVRQQLADGLISTAVAKR